MMTKQPSPKGWRWAKLGDVCEAKISTHDPRLNQDSEFTYVDITSVDNSRKHIVEPKILLGKDAPSRARQVVQVGDVIVSTTRPNLNAIAKITPEFDGQICSTGFCVLRPIPQEIDSTFLFFFVQSSEFIKGLSDLVKGALYPAVTDKDVRVREIPLPPLGEQKRIAARLDEQMRHIEQARLAAEESLSAAWELEKTYLLELFGKTSNKFQTTNIGSVAKIQTGYAFKSERFSPDGIRLLRNANVFQGYIDWGDCVRIPESRRNEFESFEMHEGDIVLSLDRPLVNNGLKVARLTANDIPSLLLQRVARFQVSESILPDYFYLFLRSPYFIDEITQHDQSIGVPHVSPKQVEAINLPLPDLKTQEKLSKEYQEKLLHTEQLIKSLETQLAEIESLPSAVLGQAFAGQL